MPLIEAPPGVRECIHCDKPIVRGWRGVWLHSHKKFLVMHCYPYTGATVATPPRYTER